MTDLVFDEIPDDWLAPGTYTEVKPVYDNMGVTAYPTRAIIVGQKLATGAAVPGVLYPITDPDEGAAYCGAGSVGAEMVRYFWKANKTTELFLIALEDDAAGIAATKTVTFTGSPTYGGSLPMYVEGTRIQLALTAGMAVAAIATAFAAAVNAEPDLPVTAAAAAGVVTLTAKHKGEVGNYISVTVARRIGDTVPEGTTVAIAAGVTGANNPDVQDVFDALPNEWLTDWVLPWDDATNLGVIAEEFRQRYLAMGKKDAHAYVGHSGTYAQMVAKGAITNSPHITGIGAKASPTAPWKWAAALAGVCAFQLTNDPARQLRSLVLPGVEAPADTDTFIESEQNLLLGKGISTFNRISDGTVTLARVVTTYKVSNLNVANRAWLDIMVPKTMSRLRYDWNSYRDLTWPRHKLADDGSLAADHADNVATPNRVRGSWSGRCTLYEKRGWIERSTETVKRSLFVRSTSDKNRLNTRLRVIIMGNLMVLAGSMEFEV